MPYKEITDLATNLQVLLPKRAQKIFIDRFDSCYFEYNRDEVIAFKCAWVAVKNSGYKKDTKTGKWKLVRK